MVSRDDVRWQCSPDALNCHGLASLVRLAEGKAGADGIIAAPPGADASLLLPMNDRLDSLKPARAGLSGRNAGPGPIRHYCLSSVLLLWRDGLAACSELPLLPLLPLRLALLSSPRLAA